MHARPRATLLRAPDAAHSIASRTLRRRNDRQQKIGVVRLERDWCRRCFAEAALMMQAVPRIGRAGDEIALGEPIEQPP